MENTGEFIQRVYDLVQEIPRGTVATYGQLAFLLGSPGRSRLVGRALSLAPAERPLPCHRVVNCQGRTAPHWTEQRTLLEAEGVIFKENGCVDLKNCRWKPL